MRFLFGREALFSVGALLISALLIQTIYATVIRPRADAILAEPATPQEAQARPARHPQPAIRVRDSQGLRAGDRAHSGLLGPGLIGYQAGAVTRNRRLLDRNISSSGRATSCCPMTRAPTAGPLESLPPEEQDMLLPRALMVALNRFGATRSVQDSAEAVRAECENEFDRFDAQLSMVRFTAWAIPAVGFVGTVRGIGRALAGCSRRACTAIFQVSRWDWVSLSTPHSLPWSRASS